MCPSRWSEKGRLHMGSGVAAALGVLELLAASDTPLSLGAMAASLGISKATVARVVDALAACGYVARHPSGRTYRIDYGVLAIAGDVLKRLILRRRAAPHLHRLAARTGLLCFLGVLWRGQTVVLDRVSPRLLHEDVLDIGKHVPMHGSSMARAILAYLPGDVLRDVLEDYQFTPLTPRTITSREAFLEELSITRARGYAAVDEELGFGARSVAAPIFDSTGYPVGALAAADWLPEQMPAERLSQVVTETREAALAVSHAIGYAPTLTLGRRNSRLMMCPMLVPRSLTHPTALAAMTRRRLLRAASAASMTGVASAAGLAISCRGDEPRASGDTSTPVTVTMWHIWDANRVAPFTQSLQMLTERKPNLHVEPQVMASGLDREKEEKLIAVLASGDPPDLFMINQGIFVTTAAGGSIVALDDFLKRDGLKPDDWYESAYNSAVWGKRLYGLPAVNSGPRLLFYNKAFFRESGLDPNRPPQT